MADSLTDIYQFNSFNKINKLECNVNIIHGDKDETIHYSHAERLFKQIDEKKRQKSKLKIIKDAGHSDIMFKVDQNMIAELLS